MRHTFHGDKLCFKTYDFFSKKTILCFYFFGKERTVFNNIDKQKGMFHTQAHMKNKTNSKTKKGKSTDTY
jgi:hypothetical protein